MKRKRAVTEDPGLGLAVEAPGDSQRTPITVTALTAAIRDVLEEGLGEVWVAGEISNFRAPGSGHLYFTLKDATSTLSAVMFRMEAARVGFPLRDGQAILARGSITVYEARGQYQLQVAEIQARGQGSLQQQFEELKKRLQAEGLFESERKRELPVFPETIGIVTSLQGAVLQDMLRILQRRAPGIRILVRGVRVQGAGAAQEIAEAIGAFGREGNVDLLVVARGGGSLEDLWNFNEEIVARALAACPLPTISAVGHETDFTIADFVADLRAPTPSAAAELLTRDWNDWREDVQGARPATGPVRPAIAAGPSPEPGAAFLQLCATRTAPGRARMGAASRRSPAGDGDRDGPCAACAPAPASAARVAVAGPSSRARTGARREHLGHLAARLRALGPQATLDRGYALLLDEAGHPVRNANLLLEGQSTKIALSRGVLEASITKAHPQQGLAETLASTNSALDAPAKKPRPRRGKPSSRPKS